MTFRRRTLAAMGPLACSLLATAGCSDTLPPTSQVVLYVTTDAPLPPPPGVELGELEPTPLFDTLRFDVYTAGADEPCEGCTRAFAVDRDMMAEGRVSIGVPAGEPLAEQRVRIRLFLSSAELGDEPSPSGSIDVTARIPALKAGEVEPIHVVLDTESVGEAVGSLSAPLDPTAGLPDPEIVGSWEGAARADCPGEPEPGEVCVPGGAFWMGDVSQLLPADPETRADQRRIVVLSPFFVDETEVTVRELIDDGGYTGSDPAEAWNTRDRDQRCTFPSDPTVAVGAEQADLPVSCISFFTAAEYCAARGGSLPTEAQLEYLMSGLRGARFPWGDDLPSCSDAAFSRYSADQPAVPTCGVTGELGWPVAVGSGVRDRLTLPTGTVVDLAGNVREWTRDGWEPQGGSCWTTGVTTDPHCPIDDPPTSIAVRGGSWAETPLTADAARRGYAGPGDQLGSVGFRCMREIDEQEPPPPRPAFLGRWSFVSPLLPRDVQLLPSDREAPCRGGDERLDACPRIFVAGKVQRTVDPLGTFQPRAVELDAFDGTVQSELGLEATGGGEARAVAFSYVGPTVVGSFEGTLTATDDPSLMATSAGGEDGFVMSGFPGGSSAVAPSLRTFGAGGDDRAMAATRIDLSMPFSSEQTPNRVWVGGSAEGVTRMFGEPIASSGANFGFATWLDPLGAAKTYAFSGSGATARTTAAASQELDGIRIVTVGGTVRGAVDFGGGTVSDGGSEDGFLVSYNSFEQDGAPIGPLHSIVIGGDGDARIEAVSAYRGLAIAVGDFEGTLEVSFDGVPTTYESRGGRDAFVVMVEMLQPTPVGPEPVPTPDPGRGVQSVQVIGGPGDQSATGVAVNASGAIVVVGSFEETASVAPLEAITSAGETDAFVLELVGTELKPSRILGLGGAGLQRPTGVALTDDGTLVVVGEMENTLDLGSGVLDATTVSPAMPLVGFIAALDLTP